MSDKQEETKKQNVQADDQSIAIGSIEVGGNVSGNITIGGFSEDEVSSLIKEISSTFKPKPFDGRCPYKGLDVFEEEDAELFFGREKIVEDLVERVKESRTVFITGPSGSGKSSLVRAGLIPVLKQGGLKNSERWLYETVKPGRDPLEALALAFSRLKSPELGKYFRENFQQANVLHECAESAFSGQKDQRLVLFFDQFEELFTQVGNEKVRTSFLNLLTHAATVENGRIVILFAMRSDFVSNCAAYPELNALLNQEFVQIGAMGPDELVSAIAQPALRVGLRIDPDLIAQIINDMQGEPGALPLMQFALKDLFEAEQAKGGMIALTREVYLQRGGIQKSLERHADESFAKLDAHEQELARSIFGGLIEIGRGTEDTRRTALFDELVPLNRSEEEVKTILQKLGDARLVTTEEKESNKYTITHEKLIDAWPWLKKLVNENRDVIALQNQIATDAKEWGDQKRDKSYLYTGARLANAREQLEAKKISLSSLAQEFVGAGRSREQRGRVALFGVILAIFIVLVVAVGLFNKQANDNAQLAIENQQIANTAQAASTFAVTQQLAAEANAAEAQNQANIARSNFSRLLAKQALELQNAGEFEQALLFSLEAYQASPTFEALNSLRVELEFALNHYKTLRPMGSPIKVINNNIVFDQDGNLVVAIEDGDVSILSVDLTTGKTRILSEFYGKVRDTTFTSDSTLLAISSQGVPTIRFYNTMTGQKIGKDIPVDVQVGSIKSDDVFHFSIDKKKIATMLADKSIVIWDVTNREIEHQFEGSLEYSEIAFTENGDILALLENKSIIFIDGLTGRTIGAPGLFENSLRTESLVISPDQKIAAVGLDYDPDGMSSIILWDMDNQKIITFPMLGDVQTFLHPAFSYDNKLLAFGDRRTGSVWLIDLVAQTASTLYTNSEKVSSSSLINFTPDNKNLMVISRDGSINLFDLNPIHSIKRRIVNLDNETVIDMKFSANSSLLFIREQEENNLAFNIATGQFADFKELGSNMLSPTKIQIKLDCLYTTRGGCTKTEITLVDPKKGTTVFELGKDEGDINSVAVTSNGNVIAAGQKGDSIDNGSIYLIDVASGRQEELPEIIDVASDQQQISPIKSWKTITALAFSPDGKFLFAGNQNGTIARYDLNANNDGYYSDPLIGNRGFVASEFLLSEDGQLLVSASAEADSVLLWDATTMQALVELPAKISSNSSFTSHNLAISPNEKWLAILEEDKVSLWNIDFEYWKERACQILGRNFSKDEWREFFKESPYHATCDSFE